jgi:hypothetical protein
MPSNAHPDIVEIDVANTPASEANAADAARVDELTKLIEEAGDEEGDSEESPEPEGEKEASIDDIVADEEAEPEPEPDAAKPKAKKARKPKAKKEAPPPEPAPAEPEVPDAAEQARQYYALRQGQKQVKEAMRVMEERERSYQEREAKLQEQESIIQLMREKPTEAMRELARRGGMSPDAYYEQLTREQLDQPPGPEQAMAANHELRKEVAELRADMKRRDEEREQQGRQAILQQNYSAGVTELMSVKHETYTQNPEARARWGYAMSLPTDELAIEARAQMNQAQVGVQLGPADYAHMMDTINGIVKARYDAQKQFLDSLEAAPEDQETSEPEQEPEPTPSEGKSPKTGKTPSTVTTHDTATGGVGHREMSETEYWDQAGEKLGDFDV